MLLRELDEKDIAGFLLVDSFMVRDHVLQVCSFYNGDIEPKEIKEKISEGYVDLLKKQKEFNLHRREGLIKFLKYFGTLN